MKPPIVLLQSYPRSGNTLVRHVIEDVFGVRTMTDYSNEGRMSPRWEGRQISATFYTDAPVVFIKTHEPTHRDTEPCKIIYIVRDGRDALLSYAHFIADFKQSEGDNWRENLDRLIDGDLSHWGEHVSTLEPKADATIRFEELIDDPVAYVSEALWKVGVLDLMPDDKPEGLPDFASLHAESPKFYRKGKVGQWQTVFTRSMVDRFWKHHGAGMEWAGYEREGIEICR